MDCIIDMSCEVCRCHSDPNYSKSPQEQSYGKSSLASRKFDIILFGAVDSAFCSEH